MVILLTVIHILVAVSLILIVLLQSGKGSGIAGAFGGMGSQAAFGPRGTATFLSKATITLAAVFMVTSVTLSVMASRGPIGGSSLLGDEEAAPAQPAPATTPAPAPTPAPSPAGTPAVQVEGGLPGMSVEVGVENARESPTGAPAAQVETGPAPAGNAPAPAPTGQ